MNIETNKNNILHDEEIIRQMIQSQRKTAPENLKYRVMNQIETVVSLTPKPSKKKETTSTPLEDLLTVFGWMYVVLIALTGAGYFFKGVDFIKSTHFIYMLLFIVFLFSLFWTITRVDAFVQTKRRK